MQRLQTVSNQITQNQTEQPIHGARDSLTITDNRTGKTIEIPVKNNYIKATKLEQFKDKDGEVLRCYDPGYLNTINCTSKISFIDGDKGILEYRGYPIEQLAEKSTFLEVAFLLIFGELPSKYQYEQFVERVMNHTYIHTDASQMLTSYRYDAHPMGMVISAVAAVSTFHPEANPALVGQEIYKDMKLRNKQVYRLLGIMPTIAAQAYRHRIGRSFNEPNNSLSYVENFLYMLDKLNEKEYKPNPKLVRALDILFILHAEHELNCSTAAVRHLASSGVDVYTAMAGGISALYGPSHGGANEAVIRMLEKIQRVENIPQFIQDVKNKKAKLMGFGHRVYKNYDPRAKIVKKIAYEVFETLGKEPLVDIALELEKIALNDEYFIKRKLFPNVDFYSGVIYRAMGFPTDMFPLLFTLPRMAGWIAHWYEFLDDQEQKIIRPRQNYQGYKKRDYVEQVSRQEYQFFLDSVQVSQNSKRRNVALVKKSSDQKKLVQKQELKKFNQQQQ